MNPEVPDPTGTAAIIWTPTDADRENARVTDFMAWLGRELGLEFSDYESLRRWSIDDVSGFWAIRDRYGEPADLRADDWSTQFITIGIKARPIAIRTVVGGLAAAVAKRQLGRNGDTVREQWAVAC